MYPNKYLTELVKDALENEIRTVEFYERLAADANDIDDKERLRQICLDESKHKSMLSEMYRELEGKEYEPADKKEPANEQRDVLTRIAESIDKELEGVELYRPILFALENKRFKNYLQEIITDEQNHAARLNFMYSKNK